MYNLVLNVKITTYENKDTAILMLKDRISGLGHPYNCRPMAIRMPAPFNQDDLYTVSWVNVDSIEPNNDGWIKIPFNNLRKLGFTYKQLMEGKTCG